MLEDNVEQLSTPHFSDDFTDHNLKPQNLSSFVRRSPGGLQVSEPQCGGELEALPGRSSGRCKEGVVLILQVARKECYFCVCFPMLKKKKTCVLLCFSPCCIMCFAMLFCCVLLILRRVLEGSRYSNDSHIIIVGAYY